MTTRTSMQMKLSVLLVGAALAAMSAPHAFAQKAVTDQMIENDAKSTGDIRR